MKLFTRFIKSIYSPDNIASYRTVKTGGLIAQIILIACLAFIPTGYLVATQSTALLANVTDVVKNDFPDFTIKDGTLTSTSDKTIMKTLNQGVLGFSVADEAAESSLAQLTPVTQIGVGFFKDGLVVEYFGSSQTIPYSMFNFDSKDDLVKMLDSTKESSTYVLSMIFVFMLLLLLVMTTIKVFFYGLFAFLLGRSGRKNINYLAAVKISAFSWSLMTVFTFITEAASISISYSSEFNILITIVIMFLAVKRIPMEK